MNPLFEKARAIYNILRTDSKPAKGKLPEAYRELVSRVLVTKGYDGEKNHGEIGPVTDYRLDYYALSFRSWEAELTNEIAHTIIGKYVMWMIGSGLMLKADPQKQVLLGEGITTDSEKFNNEIERRWEVWANSTMSDHSGKRSFNMMQSEGVKNVIIGGDVLVILRVENGIVTVELKDGAHIVSPTLGTEWYPKDLPNGNRIINGVETDAKGQVVAYYVSDATVPWKVVRIKAKNSQGFKTAYMVYGRQHRLDNNRGIGILSSSLERLSKLDRYVEATVASAEEQAKVAFQIVHGRDSTGESPLAKQVAKAFDANANGDAIPVDTAGQALADQVAATTDKSVYNNTPDSEIKTLQASSSQLYFKEFVETNVNIIAASIPIPPNVAMSLYNDSFSASRAATKDWEHTLSVGRSYYGAQFLQPIYELFLHIEVMKNKVSAPGYLQAFIGQNQFALAAYRKARFTGKNFPHIDPLKEVNAERAKLGDTAKSIPFTTVEQAVESLGLGDADANMEQYVTELQLSKDLGIEVEKEPVEITPTGIKTGLSC